MPRPIVQRLSKTTPSASKRCRVFVSYSHEDMADAQEFMTNLRLLLRGMDELHISEEQIFFDQNKLRAGDYWGEKIKCALEEADYFVFLVSRHSLASDYCYSMELRAAAKNDVPIIQVVLQECLWEEQPIPGDPKKRKLGALGAIPKDDTFRLLPIARWPIDQRDRAWNYVVKQLAEKLKEATLPNTASTARPSETLLPFFCNQVEIVNRFNNRITQWNKRALLVLTTGIPEDNLPKFCDRLRGDLRDYLIANNTHLIDHKPFTWPFPPDKKPIVGEESSTAMLQALSNSLAGNRHEIKNESLLSQWLSRQGGVVSLLTELPNGGRAQVAAGLKVLLNILEHSPVDTKLDKLAITAFTDAKETTNVLRDSDLIKALSLSSYQRTHIIDLQPLQEIGWSDIRNWHLMHNIETKYEVPEDVLLKRVFGNKRPTPLRLGTFAARIQGLL